MEKAKKFAQGLAIGSTIRLMCLMFFLIDFVIQLYLVEELASFVEYTVNWISRSICSLRWVRLHF